MSLLDTVGSLLGSLDRLGRGVRRGIRNALHGLNGPLQGVAFWLILIVTGIQILVQWTASALDRAVAAVERWAAFFGLLAMTLLAFNEYLQRELRPAFDTDLGGLWAIEGQMNVALLLLVVVGFLGASLATQEDKHIAVDAVDRVLSPGSAKWVKRFTHLVATALCVIFTRGAWDAVFSYSRDAFEGVKVWAWMVAPINALVTLLPGDKFGPGTAYETLMDWEDAQYDADLDPFEIPAFGYVVEGDRFPLWLPLLLLVGIFGIMAVRFLAKAIVVKLPEGSGPSSTPSRRPADIVLAGAFPGALIAMALGVYWGMGPLIVLAGILMVLLGAPLFVGVGVGTVGAWVLLREGSPEGVINDMFEATKKQELLAIPFFVLAGNLMTEGSIAKRLIEIAKIMLGGIPGGLGVGAVLSCAFFAAISGSSPVTVIAIGSIIFPMLVAEGYGERYAMGVLTSAGSLGIVIPPSVPMLIYAIIVSGNPEIGVVDPTVLFKAGILPGMFIAFVLILYTFYVTWPREGADGEMIGLQHVAAPVPEGSTWGRELGIAMLRGLPSLMLPVIVLGGIYGWVDLRGLGVPFHISFTITEAAAVAVVYALFVELGINRELKWREVPKVFSDSAVMMGSLFLVIVIAISLNRFFVFEQIPESAAAWMIEHVDSKLTFLIMVNLFLLALGCVMDIISAILIVAPLIAPIAASYGIHPIHFAIMFIVNLELGYLTPPLGINLFVATTVFERPVLEVIRSVVPFLFLMLFCLLVIVFVPELSLVLIEGS